LTLFFAKNQIWPHCTEIEAGWLQGACKVVLKTDNSSVLSITVLHADNTISTLTKFFQLAFSIVLASFWQCFHGFSVEHPTEMIELWEAGLSSFKFALVTPPPLIDGFDWSVAMKANKKLFDVCQIDTKTLTKPDQKLCASDNSTTKVTVTS